MESTVDKNEHYYHVDQKSPHEENKATEWIWDLKAYKDLISCSAHRNP